jgi:hypothetical protein
MERAMTRTLIALCLSLAASVAFAADPATGANEPQAQCPKAAARAAVAAATSTTETSTAGSAPVAPARPRSGAGGSPARMVSPRWHTLLPGMFR